MQGKDKLMKILENISKAAVLSINTMILIGLFIAAAAILAGVGIAFYIIIKFGWEGPIS
jgi:hypothetical protein